MDSETPRHDPVPKSIEGKISTKRHIGEYAFMLGFRPKLLEGQKVLNFGCGGSNIGAELDMIGIKADVIDLDIMPDPSASLIDPVVRFIRGHIHPNSPLQDPLETARKFLGGIEGRDFSQADGRALPFKDRTFDTVLALQSTYQIPDNAKATVYKELMRVSNIIHSGPVLGREFKVIQELAEQEGFEIICSQPIPFIKQGKFVAKSQSDYDEFHKLRYEERVNPPKNETGIIIPFLRVALNNGNYVILRRKELQQTAPPPQAL